MNTIENDENDLYEEEQEIEEEELSERDEWSGRYHFLSTAIGFVVGLGNIWRFPTLVLENGGGTFLFAYFLVNVVFGFPILYLELSLGQFSRFGPALCYGKLSLIFQGLGWAMILISIYGSISYQIIISWTVIYLEEVFKFTFWEIYTCNSTYNTKECFTPIDAIQNGNEKSTIATEEFFKKMVTNTVENPNISMNEVAQFQWILLIAVAFIWILVGLVLFNGLKTYARISYIFSITPFLIIFVLCTHGFMLEGAFEGLKFFFVPDFKKLIYFKTWQVAVTQNIYSLSIGVGGLLTLSSYNKRKNNIFKDAIIINVADFLMNILAGMSAFCVLGTLALFMDREIEDIAIEGTYLAFIIYPASFSFLHPVSMFLPLTFGFLFFLMLFLLGFSTIVGLTEVIVSGFIDTFPMFRSYRVYVVAVSCILCMFNSLVLTTRIGVFFFALIEDYSNKISLHIVVLVELLVVSYVYAMMGNPRGLGKIFGSSGYMIMFSWLFICPCFTLIITYLEFKYYFQFPWRFPSFNTEDPTCKNGCEFNWVHYLIANFLSFTPTLFAIAVAIYHYVIYHQDGRPFGELFETQEDWPSYELHQAQRISCIRRTFMLPLQSEQNLILEDSDFESNLEEIDEDIIYDDEGEEKNENSV